VATKANDRQVGGDHYKGSDYQHWDFANDIKMLYLPGVASKYVARWRKKNGVEDLEKAVHYLDKCIEVQINVLPSVNRYAFFWRFAIANNLNMRDAWVIWLIMEGCWDTAREGVKGLLATTELDALEAS